MIPYASCMCFREDSSRRAWKILVAQRGTSLVIGETEFSYKRYQRDYDEVLSESEIYMLQRVKKRFPVAYGEQEVRGRRSRQPVITKIIDLSLLDDTYTGVTKILLSRCNSWSFNTFNLDVSTGGRSLSYLLVHLFQEYGFVNHFQLDIVKVWHCFNLMEAAYHPHNPYHNSVHAADVTQAMHCFLQENKFSRYLTPLEAMSSVIAAVAHDLDHPGVTQAFLVATSNHLVNLYNNCSVLENHHWRTAISCLKESGIFSHLDRDIWLDIQKQVRSLILATDITRQKEFLARFKDYLSSNSLNMEDSQYRHFALQIALKCADLCNPCRPWTISQRWSYQVCQEFYRQGAYERQLKLPLTPTFDCSRTKVAKIQADFFQFVVSPLFETWDHFLKTPLSKTLLENLKHNFKQWEQRMQQLTENRVPQIIIESSPEAHFSLDKNEDEHLLATESDIILKQHRSKSDSGLSPRLLSPKIHMETYSTEELHPSTTLLSLSSVTNTVQLRQVYAATKIESHLICPTIFLSEEESCSNSVAQSSQKTKNTFHSENIKLSQVLPNRRASDFNKVCTTENTFIVSGELSGKLPYDYKKKMPSFSSNTTANEQFLNSTKTSKINSLIKMCSNKRCSSSTCICESDTPSWCWHISRSFSAERPVRPTQDFDLLAGQGSVSSLNYRRRGSAPVTFSDHSSSSIETKRGLRGGCESGRRWSIPVEISGFPHPSTTETRKSSLLEPLLSVSTLDTPLKHSKYKYASSDLFSPEQRRRSLPTDLYHSGEERQQTKKTDLLSVLIGPSGVLNTMHGLVNPFHQFPVKSERRKSGGIEMFSGIWKSRINDTNKLTFKKQFSALRTEENNPTVDREIIYRRGSVPLTISLLSLSSSK